MTQRERAIWFVGLLSIVALTLFVPTTLPVQGATLGKGNANCKLTVPPEPLTADGLATPWVLSSGGIACHEGDPNSAVFVQATIFSPSARSFAVYSPLVIDAGTTPAVVPTVPTLPTDAVVAIFIGGDDNSTRLVGNSADVAQCQNGSPGVFGQVAFCGTGPFWSAVGTSGVTPPPLGTAVDGMPCPTVRDFAIVDQDQSDNVQTTYLVTPSGSTAQDTAANRASIGTFGIAKNPSDNRVVTNFMLPALGCHPWTAPDLANGGAPAFSQALDELQANSLQAAPQALMPAGDPMVMLLTNNSFSLQKVNEYRASVDQPQAASLANADTGTYCKGILDAAPARLMKNKALLSGFAPPVSSIGSNLFTFMAARLSFTLSQPVGVGLNCTGLLGISNPVHLTLNSAGVAIDATIDIPGSVA